MSDLQTATDIVALVFMGIILLSILVLAISVLMLKRKMNKARAAVREKIGGVLSIFYIGKRVMNAFKK